eukprot:TRINITY_DN2877_c0_g1_i2.p1 TRINITY_DN2877_c0_g1~~TRINITY_DN2877_c0_g1_i2.p1  ORF type:complete len:232 (+),score=4.89 TRINITY_DN2877_c0_g1_i2:512-1207(+)
MLTAARNMLNCSRGVSCARRCCARPAMGSSHSRSASPPKSVSPSSSDESFPTELRVAILGPHKSGKSSLVLTFVNGTFPEQHENEIENSYRKGISINGNACYLDIVDADGSPEYAKLLESWIRPANAYVLVYSIDDRKSFDEITPLWEQILRIKDVDYVDCVIVGAKCDLESDRKVPTLDGENLSSNLRASSFMEVSSKDGVNVTKVFERLVSQAQKTAATRRVHHGGGRK